MVWSTVKTSQGKSAVSGVISHAKPLLELLLEALVEPLDEDVVFGEHCPPRQASSISAVHAEATETTTDARPRRTK